MTRLRWQRCGTIVAMLLAGSVAGAMGARAQGQTARYTLGQAIGQALRANPDLRAVMRSVEIAQGELAQAQAGFYPRVELTELAGLVPEAKGTVTEPRTKVGEISNLGPFTKIDLSVVQPLYTFGRLTEFHRSAAKGVEAKEALRAQKADEVVFAVKELYYGLLISRQVASLLGEVRDNFQKAIDKAQERLDAGDSRVTQADLLKLRVGLAEISKETLKAERGGEVARVALLRAMGLPADAQVDVADTELEPASARLVSLQEYTAQLFRARPEWRSVVAGLEAKEAELAAERKGHYPTIFVAGGVKFAGAPNRTKQDNPFAKDEFNFFEAGAAFGLRWDLSFFSTQANVQKKEAEMAQLREQKRSAELGLPVEAQKAYSDVITAKASIELSEESRRVARSLLVLSFTNFSLGVGEAKDLFEALGLYTRSASEYYRAVHGYNVALAKLSLVVGREVTELKYERE